LLQWLLWLLACWLQQRLLLPWLLHITLLLFAAGACTAATAATALHCLHHSHISWVTRKARSSSGSSSSSSSSSSGSRMRAAAVHACASSSCCSVSSGPDMARDCSRPVGAAGADAASTRNSGIGSRRMQHWPMFLVLWLRRALLLLLLLLV
jgi:hypothetical protein